MSPAVQEGTIFFNEGYLRLPIGEEKPHLSPLVYFGPVEESVGCGGLSANYKFTVPVDSLRQTKEFPLDGRYRKIDDNTEAARTQKGGLELKHRGSFTDGTKTVSVFSPEEYARIREHF